MQAYIIRDNVRLRARVIDFQRMKFNVGDI